MDNKLRNAVIIIGWSICLAAINLRSTYDIIILQLHGRVAELSAFPKPMDFVLIVIVGLIAGALLSEPEWIVLGYLGSLALGSLIMSLCITLPASLGLLRTAAVANVLSSVAVVMTFRAMFFGPMIINFISGLLGGFLGERMGLR